MAKVVLGIGTSHAPSLSTPVEVWPLHADRDQVDHELWFRGSRYEFDELVEARRPEGIADQLSEQRWTQCYDACEKAVVELRDALRQAAPDVVVIVGDDQYELFREDCIPALGIYRGQQISVTPVDEEDLPVAIRPARWAMYGDRAQDFPCAADLAYHLTESAVNAGFDLTQSTAVADGRTLGHAYNYFFQRLLDDSYEEVPPIVPIFVNAAHPPNQPTAARMIEFGRCLGEAIASWPDGARVVVIASGGLSHFVVDEVLDRQVLDALLAGEAAQLAEIPNSRLMSSTGEIRNWIAVGSALREFPMELVDYIPIYRTAAGTGIGMAYALWRPPHEE